MTGRETKHSPRLWRRLRQFVVCAIVIVYPPVQRALDPNADLETFYVVLSIFFLILMFEVDSLRARQRSDRSGNERGDLLD